MSCADLARPPIRRRRLRHSRRHSHTPTRQQPALLTAATTAAAAAAAATTTSLLSPTMAMDIHFYFHRWLLFMSLTLLMHQCQDVQGRMEAGRMCPQGQLQHEFYGDYIACCFPTRCGVGFKVKPCVNNGTQDTCEACGRFTNQSQRTSSFTMNKQCVNWPLNKRCQIDNAFDWEDPRTHRCLCDIENGFQFASPEVFFDGAPKEAYCQATNRPCEPGLEPTIDGKCRPCQTNHFKAKAGYQLCEPKTDCAQLGLIFTFRSDATRDDNCSEPVVLTTPKPVITAKPTPPEPITKEPPVTAMPKPVVPVTTGKAAIIKPDSSPSAEDKNGDDDIAVWPIICSVVFVVVIAVVIAYILFIRRRRVIPCCSCLGLKVNDLEKYSTSQCPHNLPPGDHHLYKNGPSTPGHFMGTRMNPGEKIMNNNINGGLMHGIEAPHMTNHHHPHLQHNGGTFVQFSGTDSSDSETQMHFQNQQNSFQANVGPPPSSRPGILRNGTNKPHLGQMAYAQALASRPLDASMDSIGCEKLHINMDRYQANQDLGENDPLLITGATSHSPPLQQMGSSQVVFLPHNTNYNPHCQQNVAGYAGHPIGNINPNFSGSTSSGNSSPAIQLGQPAHQVTFAPTLDTVTYKRSISVIANPEGEAEEELEANVPRFSQLLPDAEGPSLVPSLVPSNPILRMAQERETMDSPQRETTHQTRTPSERLQTRTPQNPQAPTFIVPHAPEPVGRHQQSSRPSPFFARHPSSSMENAPDHCIMDLKEHQLANSLTLSSANGPSSGETMLKHTADTNFSLDDFTASAEQTDMKTLGGTIKEEENNSRGAGANSRVHPHYNTTGMAPEGRIRKPSGGGVMARNIPEGGHAHNPSDNRRFPHGSNSVDRKRTHSGGSNRVPGNNNNNNSNNTNMAERKRVPSGDKQKSCLKNSGQEEGDGVNNRVQRLGMGRGVSFEEEEVKQRAGDPLGHETEPKQISDSTHHSGDQGRDNSSASWTEAKKPVEDQNTVHKSDDDEDVVKFRRSPGGGGETELSSSDSTSSSPSRNNGYRRSKSESQTDSTDSTHKPPPRSMSEEKSQKADRPIAKVKPMPASDSSVNQVPAGSGATEEVTATTSSPAVAEDTDAESSMGSTVPDYHSNNAGEEMDEEEDLSAGDDEDREM